MGYHTLDIQNVLLKHLITVNDVCHFTPQTRPP